MEPEENENIEDTLEQIEDAIEENIAVEEISSSPSTYKKGEHTYVFTCPTCGKVISINSDMYSKAEDKKSMHICPKRKS